MTMRGGRGDERPESRDMTSPHRTYPYDVYYDHLDRSALLEILTTSAGYDPEDLAERTRTELIDAIIDSTVETEYHAEELGDSYPLRRPSEPQALSVLREIHRAGGNHVYWCWMDDWEAAVESLNGDLDEVSWGLPPGVRAGDVIVTAVNSEPSLVVCVEQVSRVESGTVFVEPRWTVDQAVPVHQVEAAIGAKLPHTTMVLVDETGDALLDQVVELLENPQPMFVVAGDCIPDDRRKAGSAVHSLRILQDKMVACAACGADGGTFELHYFRPRHFDLQLEIQDHLDDAAQLCTNCHRLCHSPSLKRLREFVRPTPLTCPECGVGNPREYIWGMPVDLDVAESDDVILGGCVLPGGPAPEYQCRACETDFSVVRAEGFAGSPF